MSSVTRTVFYREFWAGLFSPSRYVIFGAFFAVSAVMLSAALQIGNGKFWTLPTLWLFSVAVPLPMLISLITMPLFAAERSAGTFEQLKLLPIPLRKIVIAKFLAAFISVCVAIAGSVVPWLLLCHTLGDRAPSQSALTGPLIILTLHSFSWTALGTLSSSIARRPWVAAVCTILIATALTFSWAALSRFYLSGNWQASSFPIFDELFNAASGRITIHSVIFHISFGLWCLFASIQCLEARR